MVTVRSDIALLKLATPACFSHTMSPMCLPETTDEFPPGLVCATTGWGRTKYNGEHDLAFVPRKCVCARGGLSSTSHQGAPLWLFLLFLSRLQRSHKSFHFFV